VDDDPRRVAAAQRALTTAATQAIVSYFEERGFTRTRQACVSPASTPDGITRIVAWAHLTRRIVGVRLSPRVGVHDPAVEKLLARWLPRPYHSATFTLGDRPPVECDLALEWPQRRAAETAARVAAEVNAFAAEGIWRRIATRHDLVACVLGSDYFTPIRSEARLAALWTSGRIDEARAAAEDLRDGRCTASLTRAISDVLTDPTTM
jgi:hypothetical protein